MTANEYTNLETVTSTNDILLFEDFNSSSSSGDVAGNMSNLTSATSVVQESVFFKSTVIITFLAIFVVGVLANGLVIALALKPIAGTAPTTINTYIVNVAAADLLYILGCLFFTLTNYNHGGWLFGDIGCRVIMSWDILTMHVSIYILTVMSLERYVAVVHPIESYKYRSVGIARKISAGIWISALCLSLPMVVSMSEIEYMRNGVTKRTCGWTVGDINSYRHYMTVVFVVTFLIPSTVTALVYTKMAFHFCRIVSPTDATNQRSSAAAKPRKQNKRKVVQTLFIIIIFFWMCYIPFWIYQLILLHGNNPKFDQHNIMGLVTIVLSYLNSCCNPFLYTLLPRRYNVWRRIRRKPSTGPSTAKSTQKTTSRSHSGNGGRASAVL